MYTLQIPSSLVKNVEQDYEQRALVGMIFGPRPAIEILTSSIKTNWEPKGIEVLIPQAARSSSYISLMKILEMALHAITTSQWVIRTSP